MDVATWNKRWIKRELDGFGLYSMVFNGFIGIPGIHRNSLGFIGIQWYLMVLDVIQWYSMVSNGIQCYCRDFWDS